MPGFVVAVLSPTKTLAYTEPKAFLSLEAVIGEVTEMARGLLAHGAQLGEDWRDWSIVVMDEKGRAVRNITFGEALNAESTNAH